MVGITAPVRRIFCGVLNFFRSHAGIFGPCSAANIFCRRRQKDCPLADFAELSRDYFLLLSFQWLHFLYCRNHLSGENFLFR